MNPILMGVIRHALTAFGGALVTNGTLSSDELNMAIGAVITLVGVVASVLAKRQAPEK